MALVIRVSVISRHLTAFAAGGRSPLGREDCHAIEVAPFCGARGEGGGRLPREVSSGRRVPVSCGR